MARTFTSLLLLLVLGSAGCSKPAAASQTALVFAAASLTAPFEAIGKEFEHQHPGSKVEFSFAGTPQLVVQLREGAAADVLASADMPNLQKIVVAGQTAAPPMVFAHNRLTIVTAKGNPKAIHGLADLARKDLKVALCGPDVPAGKYARQALTKAGTAVQSVSDEPNVKAVVSKVQLGEIDAGIVYVTDAASAAATVAAVPIADEYNIVADYPIAVLSAGKNRALAEQFVAFVLSDDGQRILQRGGFQRP
jgi:molybdate transport system substrate-binding protein